MTLCISPICYELAQVYVFGLPFLPCYTLFLSDFGMQWMIRLILSSGLLYIFTNNRLFTILWVISVSLAYILYIFIVKIYKGDIAEIMMDYVEHYTIFSNGAFSFSFVLLVIYKVTSVSNQIEISKAFASAIAHEVFSPISIVKLKSEMLLDKIKNNDKPALIHEINELMKLTNYCMKNVEIILTASKNVDTQYSDIKKYSIVKCIEIALEEFYLTEEQKNIIHFDKSVDFRFKGSRHLFKHLIFNLLKNTFAHAGRDASIYIWVDKNKVHYKDTELGIKQNELPRIFDADFTKGRFGIGLHFCKKAMERMNSKIKCVSKYGECTEFIIFFSNIIK
jgi:signal transduction histidine kinase